MSRITKDQEMALRNFLSDIRGATSTLQCPFAAPKTSVHWVNIKDTISSLIDSLTSYLPPRNQPWSWAVEQLKAGKAVRYNAWLSGIYLQADGDGKLVMYNSNRVDTYDRVPLLSEFTEPGWELAEDE